MRCSVHPSTAFEIRDPELIAPVCMLLIWLARAVPVQPAVMQAQIVLNSWLRVKCMGPWQSLAGPRGHRRHVHTSAASANQRWPRRGSYSRKCSVVCTGEGRAKRYQRSQPLCSRWHLALPYTSSRLQPDGWLSCGPGPTSSWIVVEAKHVLSAHFEAVCSRVLRCRTSKQPKCVPTKVS